MMMVSVKTETKNRFLRNSCHLRDKEKRAVKRLLGVKFR